MDGVPSDSSSPASCEQPGCGSTGKRHWVLLAPAALLVANVIAPIVWGDLYPFTSAPMFRDAPQQYCNYQVLGPDGQPLAAEQFLCQRIYDGNPLGYGVGVQPPAVLEQEFGHVPSEDEVRRHIAQQLAKAENRGYSHVEVVQEIVGPVEGGRVGVVETNRWQIAVEDAVSQAGGKADLP